MREKSEILVGSDTLWQADYKDGELVSLYPLDGVWRFGEEVVFDAALNGQESVSARE